MPSQQQILGQLRSLPQDRHSRCDPPGDARLLDPEGQERWSRQVALAEQIQRERAADFPIHGYPLWRALEDAAYRMAERTGDDRS